jgi:hypothetical protein
MVAQRFVGSNTVCRVQFNRRPIVARPEKRLLREEPVI